MFAHLTQEELSERLGITRDQLASIETARRPLELWVGWKLCQILNASQLYLAFGEQPERPFLQVDPQIVASIRPTTEFREACAGEISGCLHEYQALSKSSGAIGSPPAHEGHDLQVSKVLANILAMATASVRSDALHLLLESGVKPRPDDLSLLLTLLGTTLNSDAMKQESLWAELRVRLEKATSTFGSKSELARRFNVTPASVSEWLSGQSAPTAETTLRLLKWVCGEEANQQKQSPGRASTQPERKTQVRKSTHENQTQARKKK
jgi:transcriptional regulator with XRE-family HTH domain